MSNQKLIIGYYRLSMEDDSEGESNSIINQRKLVKDYISNIPELASMPFQEFYDDGYSGSSMERPAIKQVLELARENKLQCIDRKSTRLNSSHPTTSRMPSSA